MRHFPHRIRDTLKRLLNDMPIREGGLLDLHSSHDPSACHLGLANTRASSISFTRTSRASCRARPQMGSLLVPPSSHRRAV